MSNRLQYESSPYLQQHAQNPVDWYPWGKEAFERAAREDKPIFLSIGYSTCHWCHVMAHESFENPQIAEVLNRSFVSVKVDREERPDVDQVYMTACQAMTGSGGWPTSLFLTPDRKPFFAGTYFPPTGRRGMMGFHELLLRIADMWQNERERLISSAEQIVSFLQKTSEPTQTVEKNLPRKAVEWFKQMYDSEHGGFGGAPKFPTPHNLLFLMLYSELEGDKNAADMALHTLKQMRRGGMYDHIGGGFSRYSTDRFFLVPHFEKMLYDNALLIIACCAAYSISGEGVFLDTSKDCADYVLREMTDRDGGFYSAQDADSEGGEGLYYVFGYDEILSVLGAETGKRFNEYYGITKLGNFEGKNIPNRLHGDVESGKFAQERQTLYRYRRDRMKLHLDDKILTAWNSLMIAAMAYLYRVSGENKYLDAARKAAAYIESSLCENDRLYVGIRGGKRAGKGFLEDYAYYCAALISLYSAMGDGAYLERAAGLCRIAVELFSDTDGGYRMSGRDGEELVITAKETYDGALPSGNAVLAYVLTRLEQLDPDGEWGTLRAGQEDYMSREAAQYPAGHCMFLLALLFCWNPPPKITAVCGVGEDAQTVLRKLPLYADITVLPDETADYRRLDGGTAFYVCRNHTCLPPSKTYPPVVEEFSR
ncbi:MAG: thioredoxin domain-containing protein [Clostridia bacterium]|nr:thioredoxin domain-containing protein [Clostridia bacterium]